MKLVEDWTTKLWTAWSIRLAMFAGVVAYYLADNPDKTKELLALLPDGPERTLASIGIGLLIASAATGTRLIKQGPAAHGKDPGSEDPPASGS